MSKQERATWSLLIINVLIGYVYFLHLFELGPDFAQQMPAMTRLFIKVTIIAIVLAILGEIVMHLLAGKSKDAVEDDERDRLIRLKAQRNGHFVLVAAVLALMVALVMAMSFTLRVSADPPRAVTAFLDQAGEALFMANLLLFALMLAEVATQVSRLFYYRRGC